MTIGLSPRLPADQQTDLCLIERVTDHRKRAAILIWM